MRPAATRRRRRPRHAPLRAPAARNCPPASRTGWAEPGAGVLLLSLLLLLEESVLEGERPRQGVGAREHLSGIAASVAPDAQSALVPAQPTAHIFRCTQRCGGLRCQRELVVRAGHQLGARLPLGQSGYGQLVIERAAQGLRGLPTLVDR